MKPGIFEATMTHMDEPTGARRGSPVALLYLALECERPLARAARLTLAGIERVVIGRAPDRIVARADDDLGRCLEIGVPDRWLSGRHARITRVLGRWLVEDSGSKNGTFLNGARVNGVTELADGDLIEAGHTFFVVRLGGTLPADAADLDATASTASPVGMRTLLPHLVEQLAKLGTIAASDVSVVLHGESGTGKELAARAVHALSRRAGAFVPVNCGALPPTLVESELFGHRRGAFSGATDDRLGLVRSADRGTLFLDEIGDLPLAAQPALLRVLQEREVVPVGAERAVRVDLRLVAATHRDLQALVTEGKFRADLLARITGFTLTLPPLRERRDELGLLVAEVLEHSLGPRAQSVRFGVEAARALFAYDWPLNVRELEKVLGAAVVLAADGPVRLEHLPDPVQRSLDKSAEPDADAPERPLTEAETRQRDELVALLREHHGNVSAIARALGKARMQIQRWLKRYRLDPESFR